MPVLLHQQEAMPLPMLLHPALDQAEVRPGRYHSEDRICLHCRLSQLLTILSLTAGLLACWTKTMLILSGCLPAESALPCTSMSILIQGEEDCHSLELQSLLDHVHGSMTGIAYHAALMAASKSLCKSGMQRKEPPSAPCKLNHNKRKRLQPAMACP